MSLTHPDPGVAHLEFLLRTARIDFEEYWERRRRLPRLVPPAPRRWDAPTTDVGPAATELLPGLHRAPSPHAAPRHRPLLPGLGEEDTAALTPMRRRRLREQTVEDFAPTAGAVDLSEPTIPRRRLPWLR